MRALILASIAASFLLPTPAALAQSNAIAEFRAGQLARFGSQGHAKARGLNFTIRYPRSWRAMEGERPHVVQNFVSADGSGSNCNVGIRPSGMIEERARAAVRYEALRAQLPAGLTFVSGQATSLDGIPTGEVQARHKVNRAGTAFEARTLLMMTASGTNLFILTCLTGAATPAEADRRFAAYLPLFRLIANSIVFPDRHR